MKKLLTLTLLTLLTPIASMAQYDAYIYKPVAPVVTNRDVNVVLEIKIPNSEAGSTLNSVSVEFSKDTDLKQIESVSLYYTGTTSSIHSRTQSQGMTIDFAEIGGGQQVYAHPSYAVEKAKSSKIEQTLNFAVSQQLSLMDNFFYVSVNLKETYPLAETFNLAVTQVKVGNRVTTLHNRDKDHLLRAGVNVRDAGWDNVHSYRIPALVTTNDGTLIAGYDIRNENSTDLQENVQVGINRSTDGGQSWLPMQTIIDMRGTEGLPDSQNGAGDPAILVDHETGDIYAMALWTHGIGNARAWWAVQQGTDYRKGATQVLVAKSSDDGKTWSKPLNITEQIKDDSWYILLQGPGRGITMRNGTLVFPFQYVDSARMPHATIVYSTDKGKTWTVGTPARSNTTEAQVVELPTGELMLNMRDNRGGSRAILTTTDMGKTWVEHSSSRSALREPVCMASLIEVPANQNALGKDILIFSNPDHEKKRSHITIKVSTDNGTTWHEDNQLLLDEEMGWGYSCLTMINPETVGILYESSRGQMLFQAIKLADIVKKIN